MRISPAAVADSRSPRSAGSSRRWKYAGKVSKAGSPECKAAAHGFTVLVGSRNLERGEAAAKEVGPDARAIQLDVTDENSIVAAAKRIRSELCRLDVLVNNAAISHTRRLPGMSVEELGVGDQWNRKPA